MIQQVCTEYFPIISMDKHMISQKVEIIPFVRSLVAHESKILNGAEPLLVTLIQERWDAMAIVFVQDMIFSHLPVGLISEHTIIMHSIPTPKQ